MASVTAAVHSSFFCFLLILACSSPQAQARESQFFSKAARYDTAEKASPAKEERPAVKKDEPFQYAPYSSNGYGLYGHGPEKFPPATTAKPGSSTYNYNNVDEKFNAENAPSEFSNNKFTGVNYESKEFNAAGYADNKNYANNEAAYAGNIPEKELNGGTHYKYNKEPNTRYPSYGSEREQYGMSDTRFLENGKYFYDLNAEESYRNGRYAYDPARGNPEAYGSFGERESFANGGYSYGNSKKSNGYEENSSMQGYQSNQENQAEYAP